MSQIIPSAEPFFFHRGPTACLLVHGFTGAPKEMRWMGEYLASQGYTVLGVRLAGHATQPADLIRTRWQDWLVSVEDGYHLLKDDYALPQVKVPVLLAHSRQDQSVLPENMQQIFDRLGTSDKHMLWVENSGHVITREPERQRVFAAAQAFIQRVTQTSGTPR